MCTLSDNFPILNNLPSLPNLIAPLCIWMGLAPSSWALKYNKTKTKALSLYGWPGRVVVWPRLEVVAGWLQMMPITLSKKSPPVTHNRAGQSKAKQRQKWQRKGKNVSLLLLLIFSSLIKNEYKMRGRNERMKERGRNKLQRVWVCIS